MALSPIFNVSLQEKSEMDSLRKALLTVALCGATALTAQELHLTSPDGNHEVRFYQTAVADDVRELRYSIGYRGAEVITDARAGLEMDNEVWEKALGFRSLEQPESWMHRLVADSVSLTTEVDTLWYNAYGERSTVRDHYRTATLHLSRHDDSDYRLDVEVRAYDEGIAFRYFLPEHKKAIFHRWWTTSPSTASPQAHGPGPSAGHRRPSRMGLWPSSPNLWSGH